MYSPHKPVDCRRALTHQVLTPVDQKPAFPGHFIVAGDRQIRLTQHHASYRLGIDRMRAGAWLANRDIAAAWLSWQRASRVADALSTDDPDTTAMRIAARAWLCGNAFRVHADISDGLFEELRELYTAAGDKPSLANGMAGLMIEHMVHGRVREASRLASETMALVESIGKPTLTAGLSLPAISTKLHVGEMAEALRWSQTVVELAGRDPAKGNVSFGSPLAVALASRGTAVNRWEPTAIRAS
jgi:hypothetical protein